MAKSFEEFLDFIENTLGCKLLEYQKLLLRNTYEGKHYYYCPSRMYGTQVLLKADKLLKEYMNRENNNG